MSDELLELPELMTPKQIMDVLQVSRSTIQRLDSAGLLGNPVILSNGPHQLKRYHKADILSRIERNGFKLHGARRKRA